MTTTVTVDGLTLYELRVFLDSSGQQHVNAVFDLTSGGQTVVTINQEVTTILSTTEVATVTTAFSAAQAALALAPLPTPTPQPTPAPGMGTATPTPPIQATSTPVPSATATP
jgi:hypothetical protein